MTREVILNDECVHCKDKECHDGEHFCNQAMKDNSFYKNSRLYKGLEVIKRPTYEELEKEVTELKGEANSVLDNWCRGNDPCPHLKKRDDQLTKAKEIIDAFLDFEAVAMERGCYIAEDIRRRAEEFIKECK